MPPIVNGYGRMVPGAFYRARLGGTCHLRVHVVLDLGVKLTSAAILGIAAYSPGWEFKAFGGLFFST